MCRVNNCCSSNVIRSIRNIIMTNWRFGTEGDNKTGECKKTITTSFHAWNNLLQKFMRPPIISKFDTLDIIYKDCEKKQNFSKIENDYGKYFLYLNFCEHMTQHISLCNIILFAISHRWRNKQSRLNDNFKYYAKT